MKTLEEFKKERTDLHDIWNNMSREQLLEEIWKESLDAVNMESRVALFMKHCTIDMSNTNYTLDSLEFLIFGKQKQDIKNWCEMIIDDSESEDDSVKYILEQVQNTSEEEL